MVNLSKLPRNDAGVLGPSAKPRSGAERRRSARQGCQDSARERPLSFRLVGTDILERWYEIETDPERQVELKRFNAMN